jgi:hypothetical protein
MSLEVRLKDLVTAIATDIKTLRTWITGSSTGTLASLATTNKTSLVGAINELNSKTATVPPASEAAAGVVRLATLAEVAAGTDISRAVTAAGVRQERIALRNELLGTDVPAALDTLSELADALADDTAFANTVSTALAARVRTDTATQALTTAQQNNARANIAAVGVASIGDPEVDLVAAYNAAKV